MAGRPSLAAEHLISTSVSEVAVAVVLDLGAELVCRASIKGVPDCLRARHHYLGFDGGGRPGLGNLREAP